MKLLFSRSAANSRPFEPSSLRFRQTFRASVALCLALALFLTTLTIGVSAQEPTPPKPVENEHFLIYQAADGDTVCREATALEKLAR